MNTGWTLSCSLEALSLGLRQEEGVLHLSPKKCPLPLLLCCPLKCFIYFWLRWVSVAARAFSVVFGLLIVEHGLLGYTGASWEGPARRAAPSPAGGWGRAKPIAQEQWLQWFRCTGWVAPQHVGSSWTRDGVLVSCVDRQILHHWASKEAPFPAVLWCP